jgi:hypothetical protein
VKITSPWKISWDPDGSPLVLVSIGQGIGDNIRFPARQAVRAHKGVSAATTAFLPRKQWDSTFTIEVYQDHASVEAAMLWIPAHHLAVRAIEREDLQLLSDDGAAGLNEIRLTGAVLETVDPRPNFSKLAPAQTVTSYTFRASEMIDPDV